MCGGASSYYNNNTVLCGILVFTASQLLRCKVLVATALLVAACICVAVASQGSGLFPPQAYPATVVSGSEGCPTDEQLEAVQTELLQEVCIYHISDFVNY